jgi:hypothetical protein
MENLGGLPYLMECNFEVKYLKTNLPPFYQQVLKTWQQISPRCQEPQTADQIRSQIINNNRFITIAKHSVFWRTIKDAQVDRIESWLSPEGTFLSYQAFTRKYGRVISWLQHMQILSAIPAKWKIQQTIDFTQEPATLLNPSIFQPQRLKSLLKGPIFTSSGQRKWDGLLPDIDWPRAWTLARKLTKETRLIQFQYKLMHHLLPTRDKLYHWNIPGILNPLCTYCGEEDSIPHALLHCPDSHYLLSSAIDWLNSIENSQMCLTDHLNPILHTGLRESDIVSTKHILFGHPREDDAGSKLNLMILYAKYFISIHRQGGTRYAFPLIHNFKAYFLYQLQALHLAETYMSKENQACFSKRWEAWLPGPGSKIIDDLEHIE